MYYMYPEILRHSHYIFHFPYSSILAFNLYIDDASDFYTYISGGIIIYNLLYIEILTELFYK